MSPEAYSSPEPPVMEAIAMSTEPSTATNAPANPSSASNPSIRSIVGAFGHHGHGPIVRVLRYPDWRSRAARDQGWRVVQWQDDPWYQLDPPYPDHGGW